MKPRLAAALPAILMVAACASPTDAISNLGELYSTRDGERATYAGTVTDRGFFARLGQACRLPWSDPAPLVEQEELEDPVAFALANLRDLDGEEVGELDSCERAVAVATVADLAQLDRSRIVRQRAYEVIAAQLAATQPLPARPAGPAEEAALAAPLEALLALCEAAPADAEAVAQASALLLPAAAAALTSAAPTRMALAQKFVLLAVKGARRAAAAGLEPTVVAALEQAALIQSVQVAWLAAHPEPASVHGVLDVADGVRSAAGRLLIAIDPVAATVDLGRSWMIEQNRALAPGIVTLVRVDWLRALATAPIEGANVHPSLRGQLAQELLADDAAVAWWARAAVAHLLGRDQAATPVAELKAAWLALGEWRPTLAGP